MENIIEVQDITMSFGKKQVLNHLNFHIEKDEIFGFLGPSGAGKTTTIKILTNQLLPKEGIVKINLGDSKEELLNQIGILSDNSSTYEKMTIYENLSFFAEIRNVDKKSIEALLKRVGLWEARNKKAQDLSKGMRQRLILLQAIIHKPKLLFLDEPTASLDPATTVSIHELLKELQKEHTTIFLTTHNMEEADKLCNRVAFLNKGNIVELGSPQELKLKYAKDQVEIKWDNETISVEKDATKLIQALEKNKKQKLITIHSKEPNLEEIFLELTGRDLK